MRPRTVSAPTSRYRPYVRNGAVVEGVSAYMLAKVLRPALRDGVFSFVPPGRIYDVLVSTVEAIGAAGDAWAAEQDSAAPVTAGGNAEADAAVAVTSSTDDYQLDWREAAGVLGVTTDGRMRQLARTTPGLAVRVGGAYRYSRSMVLALAESRKAD